MTQVRHCVWAGREHPAECQCQVAAEMFGGGFSAAWKDVKCADCGAEYHCTPGSDYFHRPDVEDADRTLTNGVCESCLLRGAGMAGKPLVWLDPKRQS